MKKQMILLLLFSSCLHAAFLLPITNAQEYDGAYIQSQDGELHTLTMQPSNWGYLHHIQSTMWRGIKRFYSIEKNDVSVPSFEKLILKGVDFDSERASTIHISPAVPIPNQVSQRLAQQNGKRIDKAYGAKLDPDGYNGVAILPIRKKKVADYHYEVIIDTPLEKGQTYVLWRLKPLVYWYFTIQG